jgi:hypothetical protein
MLMSIIPFTAHKPIPIATNPGAAMDRAMT